MASLICRHGFYYLDFYVGRARRRWSLITASLQIAKEYKREFESASPGHFKPAADPHTDRPRRGEVR